MIALKEATAERLSEARAEADLRAKQLEKKLQGLEATAKRKILTSCFSFPLRSSFELICFSVAVPLPDVVHEDAATRL